MTAAKGERDVVVLVGSLRRGSFNRMMAHAMRDLAPAALRLDLVEIRDLPLYDQDFEESPPEAWRVFRERIRRAHGVLFVTPEYNRSVPGGLKNAIDVASRPYGENAFDGKPAGVVTVSPGAIGGFGANHHVRQMLVFLNMPVLQQPEMYIGNAASLFDEHGALKKDDTRGFVTTFLTAYAAWIDRINPAKAADVAAAEETTLSTGV